MAIYDHRSFRRGEDWWVAEVHMASGAGGYVEGGVEPSGRKMRPTHDRVFFTCISDERVPSRSIQIPADWLNAISHHSVLRLLESSEELDARFEMSPYNAPDARDFGEQDLIEDRENLTWAFRETELIQMVDGDPIQIQALELICLDDSALRDLVVFDSDAAMTDFLSEPVDTGLRKVIEFVKDQFREYDAETAARFDP